MQTRQAYRSRTGGGIPLESRLPLVAREIVELVNNPETSTARLAAVVSKDKMLVETILRKANSSYYGFPNRVKDLNLAVALLGVNALRETVAGIGSWSGDGRRHCWPG